MASKVGVTQAQVKKLISGLHEVTPLRGELFASLKIIFMDPEQIKRPVNVTSDRVPGTGVWLRINTGSPGSQNDPIIAIGNVDFKRPINKISGSMGPWNYEEDMERIIATRNEICAVINSYPAQPTWVTEYGVHFGLVDVDNTLATRVYEQGILIIDNDGRWHFYAA